MYRKKVTVIVPCRNEEDYIEETIMNIIQQDYPDIELLIIDGESSDKTTDIILQLARTHPAIRYYNNPHKTVSFALNLGIQQSTGEIIIRMDSHSLYPANYISELVKHLIEFKVDNVGGVCVTHPGNSTNKALAISEATSNIFGIGNSSFRLKTEAIKEVDTVPFGCYNRELFNRIGMFDEELIRNQDDEFNGRVIKNGGRILLIPSIKIEYFARTTFLKVSKMFYQYGLFKPLVTKKLGNPTSIRQFFPVVFLFVLALAPVAYLLNFELFMADLGIVSIYLVLNLFFSMRIAISNRNIGLFFYMPLTFLIIHLSYGFGYLYGFIRFIIFRQTISNNQIKLSR